MDNGVEVHIVNISTKLTRGWENDPTKSIIVDIELGRALKESEYKSDRIGAAWRSKKARASKQVMTKSVPAWLEVVDGKIVEKPEMVAKVREAYRLAALGLGCRHICDKIDCGLSLAWVTRVLKDRSVLGWYSDEAPDYYPKIINQSLFDTVREVMASKRRNGAYIGGNRRSDKADNLFSGLIFDVTTTEPVPMHFQRVARGSYLASAYRANQKQNRMRYDTVEAAFLQFLHDLDWRSVAGQTESDEQKQAQRQLEVVLSGLDKTTRRIEAKTAAMDDPDLDAATLKVFATQIANDEARAAELTAAKDTLTSAVATARAKSETLYNPQALLELIRSGTPQANDVRLRLRSEIKRRVEKIYLSFGNAGMQANDTIISVIFFVNGAKKIMLFFANKLVTVGSWGDDAPSDWVTLRGEQEIKVLIFKGLGRSRLTDFR